MKIIAIIRQTDDGARTAPDYSGVEAALRLKKQTGCLVTAICLGSEPAVLLLRMAIAMGCDDALLVQDPAFDGADPAGVATILAAAIAPMGFDAIFASCYAVDADAIQTGFLLAEKLQLAQTGYAEDITYSGQNTFLVKRQFEDRSQMLEITAPCLISALPQPNKRIYGTVEGITRAYSAEIPVMSLEDLENGRQPDDPMVLELRRVKENAHIRLLFSHSKKERKRGTVLTVSTDEAVTAILDTIIQNHIL